MIIHQGGMSPWLIQQGQPDLNYNLRSPSVGREVSRRSGFHQQRLPHLGRAQAQFTFCL